jgi:hypothetical protein
MNFWVPYLSSVILVGEEQDSQFMDYDHPNI